MVILVKFGPVLVGFCSHKPVEAIEALPERPLVERPDRCYVLNGSEVPFAEGHGDIARGPQDRREHRRLLGDPAVVPRVAQRPAPLSTRHPQSGGCGQSKARRELVSTSS